jgi:hypothetical protein
VHLVAAGSAELASVVKHATARAEGRLLRLHFLATRATERTLTTTSAMKKEGKQERNKEKRKKVQSNSNYKSARNGSYQTWPQHVTKGFTFSRTTFC